MNRPPGRKIKYNPLLSFTIGAAFLLLILLLRSGIRDLRFWLALAAIILSFLCNVFVLFFTLKRKPPPDNDRNDRQ